MNFFRQQLEAELASVFLNLDEFGECHEINGDYWPCVICDSAQSVAKGAADGLRNAGGLGVFAGSRVLYMEDKLKERPLPGGEMSIDGQIWRVADDPDAVTVREGLLKVLLERPYM